jgi:hypothetical protein
MLNTKFRNNKDKALKYKIFDVNNYAMKKLSEFTQYTDVVHSVQFLTTHLK